MSKASIKATVLTLWTMVWFGWMISPAFAATSRGLSTAGPVLPSAGLVASIDRNILEAPLVAWGASSPAETQALDVAIATYQQAHDPVQTEALEAFLTQHPHSPWGVSLWLNIGLAHENAGDYPAAITAFNHSVAAAGPVTRLGYFPKEAVVDQALAELLKIETGFGNADQVAALLADPRATADGGVLTAPVIDANEALWSMRHEPEDSYRCGIIALERVLDTLNPSAPGLSLLSQAKAKSNGLSLIDLQRIGGRAGFLVQAVHVSARALIPVPSVMHWTAGHYAAVLGVQDGRYRVYDPAFGQEILMSREVLEKNASGYFLIPAPMTIAPGWRMASAAEAMSIRGGGTPHGPNNPAETGSDTPSSDDPPPPGNNGPVPSPHPPCNGGEGCPHYSVALMLASLRISDNPVGYTPPVGPAVEFTPTYNEQDASQPASPTYGNLGPQWSDNLLSYVTDNPSAIGGTVTVVTAGGGYKTETGYTGSSSSGSYAPEERAATTLVLVSSSPIVYQRRLSDGSTDVYAAPGPTSGGVRNVYLTEIVDPKGNALTLAYDSQFRLATVTDAIGQVTTFQYANANPLLLTSVTDPFGRIATLGYDSSGRLNSLTDAIGMQSSFTYNTGTYITAMTTPYGTTNFSFTPGTGSGSTYTYSLNITDPLGYTERYEYNQTSGTGYPPYSDATIPSGMSLFNAYLYGRDIYHWDKATYAVPANRTNHLAAVIYHFQHVSTDQAVQAAGVLENVLNPLESSRIWYTHPNDGVACGCGQLNSGFTGSLDLPSQVGRVLPNGSTQLSTFTYGNFGNITGQTDPVGRQTTLTYASNNIDVTKIAQKNGTGSDTLTTATWNSQHEPLAVTGADGQTTTYTYNTAGQILTKTDALNEITTYAYANRAGIGSGNFLHTITDANNQVVATYTYDTVGRIVTFTDSQGYKLSYTYDNLDRLTTITYPDATVTRYTYSKLDLTQFKDRLGRITTYAYDADRNLVSVTDPLNRITTYGYDPDGRLTSVTDPLLKKTLWTRDIEGRVITKTYSDGTTTNYTYDIAGRLLTRTDALAQVTTYGYAADDRLATKTYANTVHTTANVTYTWDSVYPRIDTMVDGSGAGGAAGTTSFFYNPVGQDGALQLSQETDAERDNAATYLYYYDVLGRLYASVVGGPVWQHILGYDVVGRVISDSSTPLGNLNFSYAGETSQLSAWEFSGTSGPVSIQYGYGANTADRRLFAIANPGTINNEVTASDMGSASGYQVGGIGRVTGRLFETDTVGDYHLDNYSFDASDRVTEDQGYNYAVATGLFTSTGNYNFGFNNADFMASESYPPSSQLINWAATPASNSNEISSITYNYVGGVHYTYPYTYDADGNVLNDGLRSYTWDAENRLLSITNIGTGHVSSFRYDGLNRRVAITEQDSGGHAVETRYLWCGDQLCDAHTTAGVVTARYLAEGEAQYSGSTQTDLYYQQDHLGSIIAVMNGSGTIIGQQFYDPFGVFSYTGTLSTFAFAGMFNHTPSQLYLTLNRAYDPLTGRWLSRDPAGEFSGGSNDLPWTSRGMGTTGVEPTAQTAKFEETAFQNYTQVTLPNTSLAQAPRLDPAPVDLLSDKANNMGDLTGLNLYAYSDDNPVNYLDPDGEGWGTSLIGALSLGLQLALHPYEAPEPPPEPPVLEETGRICPAGGGDKEQFPPPDD